MGALVGRTWSLMYGCAKGCVCVCGMMCVCVSYLELVVQAASRQLSVCSCDGDEQRVLDGGERLGIVA